MEGTEHIPRSGGACWSSNHISYLDFIFAGLGALPSKRLVRFMAKEEVFKHRISGPLMRGHAPHPRRPRRRRQLLRHQRPALC
ncbi:1-acyl-sn-glycerol-3-phosphate acyltransferase [Nonomuraea dietziae]|uniref:lysophospholipid acyltransferase family protein n=1 Tax=Nonomuraea dietziae TaxID=65515 RepID=UPI0031DFD6FF